MHRTSFRTNLALNLTSLNEFIHGLILIPIRLMKGDILITSLNAIGSGEIFGKGYKGREVYVAESHTDFIFTTIGEDWGFIGASLVICLYFFLIYHLTKITLELKDPFSTYICAGIIAMITFHVFENIGMTIQLLPITGIPLPFISYGGSSLMGNMLAIGLGIQYEVPS